MNLYRGLGMKLVCLIELMVSMMRSLPNGSSLMVRSYESDIWCMDLGTKSTPFTVSTELR